MSTSYIYKETFSKHKQDLDKFLDKMNKVAAESYRVLKKGKICAVMIGDVRKHGKVIPLGFRMMECFLNVGFLNKFLIDCDSMKIFYNF